MHIEAITDSFDGRKISAVAKIGNAYVFCDGAQFITGNPAMQKAIASISDWRDGRKPATQNRVRSEIARAGFQTETRYDAAHGRRYKLCVYPAGNQAARRVTLAASDGMSDTNPEIARAIF